MTRSLLSEFRPTVQRTKIQCPAKVNLFLEVTGKRADGYHTLATLFAKIGIFDVLEIESMPPGPIELSVDNGQSAPVPEGKDNLVYRAAEAFRKEFNVDCGVRIGLTKRIPIGAGLGGGSSDAAGILLGLSRLFGVGGVRRAHGARDRLKKLALSLGADVPLFLHSAPFCLGKGIGERLTALPVKKAPPWMVLVYPQSAISTPKVYQGLKRPTRTMILTRLSQLGTLQKRLKTGRPVGEWAGLLFNRLEDAVLPIHPEVNQAKRALSHLGAQGVLMSGSGSSVFGFVSSREEGEAVCKKLRAYPWQSFVTSCLG